MRNEINHITFGVAHSTALAFMLLQESEIFQTIFVRQGAFVVIFQFFEGTWPKLGVNKVLLERLSLLMSATDQCTYEGNHLTKFK